MKSRRTFIVASLGVAAGVLMRPATLLAQSDSLASVVRRYAGAAPLREGRVKFDIAPLVDNGNSVPITVTVESPMTALDHVVGIAVFNEKIRSAMSQNLPWAQARVVRMSPRAFGWPPRKNWWQLQK